MIEVLDIQQRHRDTPLDTASLQGFSCAPAGQAEPTVVLANPNVSLYCCDDATRRVIFVETPAGLDITAPPFLYQAQFEHAQRLLAMPYETLHELARLSDLDSTRLVLIYSVGRAGSTLLSKAFQELDTTTSLSEPDIYTQIVGLRTPDGARDNELRELLSSATKMLFRPAITRGSALYIVKFRSYGIHIADLLHAAFPEAHNLFLYRGLSNWMGSSVRAFVPLFQEPVEDGPSAGTLEPSAGSLEVEAAPIEFLTMMWLSVVQEYVNLHRQGIPMHAISYEDMVARPTQTLEELFRYLGSSEDLAHVAARAFDKDSQQGSMLARSKLRGQDTFTLTEEQRDQMRGAMQAYTFTDNLWDLPHIAASLAL